MQNRHHKRIINGRSFEGVHLSEEHVRGRRLSAKRIATLFNPATGNFREISEGQLLGHLYDIECTVQALPEAKTAQHLINRVKAGFKLPENLKDRIIDPESAIWLLDHMYGGKTVHVDKIDLEL